MLSRCSLWPTLRCSRSREWLLSYCIVLCCGVVRVDVRVWGELGGAFVVAEAAI